MLGLHSRIGMRGLSTQPVRVSSKNPAVAASAPLAMRKVDFKKESLSKVMSEVPDFNYYLLPQDAGEKKSLGSVPMTRSTLPSTPVAREISPEYKYSVLENGLRVVTTDRGGMSSNMGLFVDAGSRYEGPGSYGATHMLEHTAFHSTAHLSWLRTVKTLESMSANCASVSGRENISYTAECLREFSPIVATILAGNVLFPRFLPWELKEKASTLTSAHKKLLESPDSHITELLHSVAYYKNTLGNKLYSTDRDVPNYKPEYLRNYMLDYFSPNNMVFSAINVDHDELTTWLMRAFNEYNSIPPCKRTQATPVYTGGHTSYETTSQLAHLAVAFETPGGWNGSDLLPLTLLQTLLGGGGAFSTGGPGKGMYSKLFLNVLNKYEWVQNCAAFNTQYSDSGLFGIYMTGDARAAKEMVQAMSQEFSKLGQISADDLQHAKNILKGGIHMNLECRGIIMEDAARQLLMSNTVVSADTLCKHIDNVSVSDVEKAVKKIKGKASVVTYGDVTHMPHGDVIVANIK